MSADVSLFVFSIVDGGLLLFLSIYSLITLSDLECDYLNVKECCLKLNRWVLPECIAYLFLIVLFLFTRHWVLFLLHLPMIIYTIYFLKTNSDGSIHPYGSHMQNNAVLKKYIKASMVKLINHLVFFFIYLYNLIINIITNV